MVYAVNLIEYQDVRNCLQGHIVIEGHDYLKLNCTDYSSCTDNICLGLDRYTIDEIHYLPSTDDQILTQDHRGITSRLPYYLAWYVMFEIVFTQAGLSSKSKMKRIGIEYISMLFKIMTLIPMLAINNQDIVIVFSLFVVVLFLDCFSSSITISTEDNPGSKLKILILGSRILILVLYVTILAIVIVWQDFRFYGVATQDFNITQYGYYHPENLIGNYHCSEGTSIYKCVCQAVLNQRVRYITLQSEGTAGPICNNIHYDNNIIPHHHTIDIVVSTIGILTLLIIRIYFHDMAPMTSGERENLLRA